MGRVLIAHGNRYDRCNRIDWSGLRQERSELSRGLRIDSAASRAATKGSTASPVLRSASLTRITDNSFAEVVFRVGVNEAALPGKNAPQIDRAMKRIRNDKDSL